MIRPPPLRPGDVVRVVAPAGPFDPVAFEAGLELLRNRFGLVPRHRPDIFARSGYLAGDDARRLAEWNEAAADADARAIWCARGGYGAMRLLERIEPLRLVHPPKWLIGFSDITALHAVHNRAGLVTVHGPMVAFLPRLPAAALEHLEALLFGVAAAPSPGGQPAPGAGLAAAEVIRPGVATGPLLGGSLTLLGHLCGTRYLPSFAGAVLFIEDVGEKPYELDRLLTQLRLSGALDGVRAIAVGQLMQCDDGEQRGIDTVRQLVRALGVPAIGGLRAGHEVDNWALPLGAVASLVAPGPGEPGEPRLLFGGGAIA
ncbi:MAG TPA: LD-carboxypeptidase [Anaeromyxobacteraceae bacterium]|nr:LD-carboxypeptidase [Anaeromyxobacteraceae bacterium]